MSRIHHCIVTNQHYHPNVLRMHQDASALGWGDIKVLGDSSMKISGPDSYGLKLILVRDYLRTLPPMDIVLVTDAHDIRVMGTPEEVKQAFLSLRTRVLVSAERNCYPNQEAAPFYNTHSNPDVHYKYVNSGGYIGYVRDILFLLEDEDLTMTVQCEDQDVFSFLYMKYQGFPDLLTLDTKCKVFQCLHMAVEDVDLERRTNRCTGEKPLVYHANGGGAEMADFFSKNICTWDLPVLIQQKKKYSEPELLQKLYESCTYNLPLDPSVLNDIHKDYENHSVIHYLLGVYYSNMKDIYMASHHFKRSMSIVPLFTHPRFELATIYLKVFLGTNVEKYIAPIYDRDTTNHPTATPPEYNLLDQLRAVSLLGPYYEKRNRNADACKAYLRMYELLLEKEEEAARSFPEEKEKYSQCWKYVCTGLSRVATVDRDQYWTKSWRDYPVTHEEL